MFECEWFDPLYVAGKNGATEEHPVNDSKKSRESAMTVCEVTMYFNSASNAKVYYKHMLRATPLH